MKVQLAKELDALISSGAADAAVDYAASVTEPDERKRMFRESFLLGRMFQLDFFLKCRKAVPKLFNMLPELPPPYAVPLIWQIHRSGSMKANAAKYDFRGVMSKVLKNCPLCHPYAFGHEQFVSAVDRICFSLCETDSVKDLPISIGKGYPQSVKSRMFLSYMDDIGYSLFAGRIAQLDFMMALPDFDSSVYGYLAGIAKSASPWTISKFSKQLFDSPSVPVPVKAFWRRKLSSVFSEKETLPAEVRRRIDACSSFQEFYLSVIVNGDKTRLDDSVGSSMVLYMLLYRLDWLKAWAEIDRDAVESNIRCCDILEER